MGRPLNKKYIGGRNKGLSGFNPQTDSSARVAGTGISGISVGTAGTYTSASVPTLTFPFPTMIALGGKQATGTPLYTVVSATVTAGGTGYANTATNYTVNTGSGTATINITATGGVLGGTVTIVTGGTFTSMAAGAQAVVGGTGSSATVTLTYGLSGATMTSPGDGYFPTSYSIPQVGTNYFTASTAGAALTVGTVTASTGGTVSFSTAQSAGTFWVGQVITITGTQGGAGSLTGYTSGQNYIVMATNGTSTITIGTLNNTTGLVTASASVAGTITGLTFTTAGTITVNTVDGLSIGMALITTGTGGTSGVTAGTYYILGVNATTNQVIIASSYANYLSATAVSITTAATVASTYVTGKQAAYVTVSTGTGAATIVTVAEITTGYGADYPNILCSAITNSTLRENCDIVKQEGSRSYRVMSPDTSWPGGFCKLVNRLPVASGEMAINATDSAGGTYWVSKITNRKVTITRNTGTQFANGAQVNWTFGSAVLNTSVTIDNA